MDKPKAPFKRGIKLDYTSGSTGNVIPVKYIKWLGFERSSLIVVERLDTKFRFTVHLDEVKVHKMSSEELARYVYENWKKVTGLPKKAMYEEEEFPDVVEKLCDEHGVDINEFCSSFMYLVT